MMTNPVQLIEVPSEIGAGTRGASLGIGAMKVAAFKEKSQFFHIHPSIEIPNENHLLFEPVKTPFAKRIDGILKVYQRLGGQVRETLKSKRFPVVLAADHSTAGGTIAGVKMAMPDARLGVVWIDAHADLHSPYTTPSGNVHGMPMAATCGLDNLEKQRNDLDPKSRSYWEQLKWVGEMSPKVQPEDVVFIGLRDLEEEEIHLMNKHGMKNYTIDEVRKLGIAKTVDRIRKRLAHCDAIYISFDVDSLDCETVSAGTGTPVANGLNEEEAMELVPMLVETPSVVAFEVTEINPTLDEKKNKMAETAFRILAKSTEAYYKSRAEVEEKGTPVLV